MQDLLKQYNNQITKVDVTSPIDVIELRNLAEHSQSVILEVGATSDILTIPSENNDSLQSFPKSFAVCLQPLDLDCNSGFSETSDLTIETTEKYELNLNGITVVLFGDALLDFLQENPNIAVEIKT